MNPINRNYGKLRKLRNVAALAAAVFGVSAQAAPKQINFAITAEPPQLNWLLATDTVSGMVLGHIAEGLTRVGKNGEIRPGVAESWKITDTKATFKLRSNAKWSDGKPVTAKDFIFAWSKALDPATGSEYAFILYPIKNAEAINKGKAALNTLGAKAKSDLEIEVEFEKPCGYFLSLLAFPTFKPIREDFYNSKKGRFGADAQDLISNGPYVLTKWMHGASLVMEKNPHYWDKDSIKVDILNAAYITSDPNALFNLYKDGKIDYLDKLSRDDLPKAQAEKYKVRSFSDGSVWYLEFNHRAGRLTANKHLRKALSMVFNQTEYLNGVVSIPGSKPANGIVPAWMLGNKATFRKEYPAPVAKQDIEGAKKELELALKELKLTKLPPLVFLTQETPFAGREAEYFQNLFKRTLGIELKIDKQIFKQRLAKMTSGDFDMVSAGWGPDFDDPMTFVELKASWNENNRGRYSNPKVDEFIRKAQNTSDKKVRMDAMAAAEKIIIEDATLLYTYERVQPWVVRDHVQGVVRHPVGADTDFTFATVTK